MPNNSVPVDRIDFSDRDLTAFHQLAILDCSLICSNRCDSHWNALERAACVPHPHARSPAILRRLRAPGLESQGRHRNLEDVFLVLDHDLHHSGHSRQQSAIEIGGRQDDRVSNHVLLGLRRLTYLPNFRLEATAGI